MRLRAHFQGRRHSQMNVNIKQQPLTFFKFILLTKELLAGH